MLYRSTRGGATDRGFADVLIEGLAPDGGLYVPEEVPRSPQAEDSYAATVAAVVAPFIDPDPLVDDIEGICTSVYSAFRHPEVAPLRPMGDDRYLLELFWGPTLSFKDYALQLVGALFDQVLARRNDRLLVLGATSGDTGSAAIEACRGREAIDIVILYPDGAISEVQRRQMTTVADANVHAVAVAGTFDDCQRLVKGAFSAHRNRYRLGAINSINWARIMAQSAYYVHTAHRLGEATFVVPTGNFGNVLAGHLARRMGAPITGLTVANNANHGLTDLIESGTLQVGPVTATVAPAMDIQVPSNLERYLFEALGDDPARVLSVQNRLAAEGTLTLPPEALARLRSDFGAGWRSDRDVLETIRSLYRSTGVLIDPHTAVAWSVAEALPARGPTVIVSTAHPAKFDDAVAKAVGQEPEVPEEIASILERPERITHIAAEMEALTSLLDAISASSA